MADLKLVNGVLTVQTVRDYVRLPGYLNVPQAEAAGLVHEYTCEREFWSAVLSKRAELK
jgi:hypothetical protein